MAALNLTKKEIYQSTTAVLALIGSVLTTASAQAADFDFSGTFQKDNDVELFEFTLERDSTVTFFSSSWLYGEPAPGQGLGGFDPAMRLWDGNGNEIIQQDDGDYLGSTVSNGVSYNHGVWDFHLTRALTAGNYTLSLVQYDNFIRGMNLRDGNTYDNFPNYTTSITGGSQPFFNGVWGNDGNDPRTGDWAIHILNVDRAVNSEPVPEPASMLGILAFGALGGRKLWKRKQQA